MGEKEDKEKAEKLAAAKKRVAQLQAKKKKAATSAGGEKSTDTSSSKGKSKKKSDKDKEKEAEDVAAGDDNVEESVDADDGLDAGGKTGEEHAAETEAAEAMAAAPETTSREPLDEDDEDEDTAAFNSVIKAANDSSVSSDPQRDSNETESTSSPASNARQHTGRQASISIQSKMRSTSFRQGPLSPTGVPDESSDSLYRKQLLKIEELETENKRLAKEATEGEARWRRSEEELEELREAAAERNETSTDDSEVAKLRAEVQTLRRNQRQSVSAGAGKSRSGSIHDDDSALKKDLESKDSTIADLQLEISRLRSQLSSQTEGCETHGEQISALQALVERAEANVKRLEGELQDAKKALSRASEKAVVDGTERTSKETKIRSLEKENKQLQSENSDNQTRIQSLETKIEAMNKLHRETEDRSSKKLSSAETQARETQMLRAKIETQDREISRLREARKHMLSGSTGDDDGLDELEDEERKRLERRVRELEGEVFDLRRGVWRDRRKEMQPGMTEQNNSNDNDDNEFDDVDLSGSMPASRRRSSTSRQSLGAGQSRHSGFTQVINSGLAAFRGSTVSPDSQQVKTRSRNDSLLQEFDDDDNFDASAFAIAQKEEEMKKMVEHVREVKKGLKQWVGWRLDLVDSRRGGGGIGVGEVFDI